MSKKLSFKTKRRLVRGRRILRKALLILVGFAGQASVGSVTNWVIAPTILGLLGPWQAFVVVYTINIARVYILIYGYDLARGAKKTEPILVTENILVIIREYVAGTSFVIVNTFYGVLYIRRKYEYGIPKAIRMRVIFALFWSTFFLVLGLTGIFSLGEFLWVEWERVKNFLIPFLIRLYF